jgi:hypothetical protein
MDVAGAIARLASRRQSSLVASSPLHTFASVFTAPLPFPTIINVKPRARTRQSRVSHRAATPATATNKV